MEFDISTIAVSSEYFIKIVFSVPVQSFVYNVKRTVYIYLYMFIFIIFVQILWLNYDDGYM